MPSGTASRPASTPVSIGRPIAPARIATCEVAARLTVQIPAILAASRREKLRRQQVAGDQDCARGQRLRHGFRNACEDFQQLQLEIAQVVGPRGDMTVFHRPQYANRLVHCRAPGVSCAAAFRNALVGSRQQFRVLEKLEMGTDDAGASASISGCKPCELRREGASARRRSAAFLPVLRRPARARRARRAVMRTELPRAIPSEAIATARRAVAIAAVRRAGNAAPADRVPARASACSSAPCTSAASSPTACSVSESPCRAPSESRATALLALTVRPRSDRLPQREAA